MKHVIFLGLMVISTAGFSQIESVENNTNLSNRCVKNIVEILNTIPIVQHYETRGAKQHLTIEENKSENEIQVVIDLDSSDNYGGYINASYELIQMANGSCKLGKILTWDIAS